MASFPVPLPGPCSYCSGRRCPPPQGTPYPRSYRDRTLGTHPITLARLRWLVANTQRAYVADWSDFTCGCLEHRCAGLPATPAGVGRYLYHLVETDGRMMATAPAHPVANAAAHPLG